MSEHEVELQLAAARMQPAIDEFAAALNNLARLIKEEVLGWLYEVQEAFLPMFRMAAAEQLIQSGWTPWVARFRIKYLLERDEVIALAQQYMEDHRDELE